MTKNQIEYLKLQEMQRTNKRQEELTAARDSTARELGFATLGETQRHNIASETHNVQVLGETKRHNIASEQHNVAVLGETQRHNLAQEAHNSALLSETSRHNMVMEDVQQGQLKVSQGQLDESRRHNQVVEVETSTHNRATEYETWRSNLAKEQETYRSNLARELETNRANVARETETHRSNIAGEQARSRELQFQYSSLAEQARYHDLSVSLGYSQLGETTRANKARELETNRANVAKEEETKRSNVARESETQRHNERVESQTDAERRAQAARARNQLNLEREKLEELTSYHQAQTAVSMNKNINELFTKGSHLIPLFMGG